MSADNENFTLLHENIKAAIKAALPSVVTVADYQPFKNGKIETPAVLVEMVEIKPAGALSGGRFAVNVEFVMHCILSIKTDNVELEVRNFGVKVLSIVNNNRWGLPAMAKVPTQLSAYPGMFKPDEDGFESWAVQFDQEVHLGDGWELPDFLPVAVFLGEAPNIGTDHKDEYRRLNE